MMLGPSYIPTAGGPLSLCHKFLIRQTHGPKPHYPTYFGYFGVPGRAYATPPHVSEKNAHLPICPRDSRRGCLPPPALRGDLKAQDAELLSYAECVAAQKQLLWRPNIVVGMDRSGACNAKIIDFGAAQLGLQNPHADLGLRARDPKPYSPP